MAGGASGLTVAIIGAGRAGRATATAALRHGLAVDLIDGSAITDRLGDSLSTSGVGTDPRCRFHRGTLAWGIFPPREVALYAAERAELLHPEAIILATGAIGRLAAFPGWELPGVLPIEGVWDVLARGAIAPGQRYLLAGVGPILFSLATAIAEAGGEVVAVVEGPRPRVPRLRRMSSFQSAFQQTRAARRALRQRGIPILSGYRVIEAAGPGRVGEVTVARVARDAGIVPDTELRYAVETLCVHQGFVAATELARQAGCQVAYSAPRGGWYVAHDRALRATLPGFYVAGQLAGIGDDDLAAATGELAGLTAAHDLGVVDPALYAEEAGRLHRRIARGRRAAAPLNIASESAVAARDRLVPETIVCPCEGIAVAQIDRALAEGAITLDDLKRRTRCGMGRCQGRLCMPLAARHIRQQTGASLASLGLLRSRPPIRPIPLAAIADLDDPGLVVPDTPADYPMPL